MAESLGTILMDCESPVGSEGKDKENDYTDGPNTPHSNNNEESEAKFLIRRSADSASSRGFLKSVACFFITHVPGNVVPDPSCDSWTLGWDQQIFLDFKC